jgi:hypothetical protein
MNDRKKEPESAAIEHITRPLKEPVRLDDSFEVRVMSAVHSAALANIDAVHTSERERDESRWWNRPITIRFSAITGLAMAASLFGIIFLGATMLSRRAPTEIAAKPATTSAPASVQNVHFILVNGSAKQVFLVGDFNGWSKKQTPLVRAANENAWTVSVPLTQGRHEYAFIVADENGDHWVADPLTPVVEDEFGTESSIVRVEPASS